MAVQNKAMIWAVLGQSGTGKGLWVKKKLKELRPNRIIILDPQDEYGDFASPFTSLKDLAIMVTKAGATGSFRVRYLFPKGCKPELFASVFNVTCQLAYMAGNCVFLPEELSNFTTPSYAPPLWRRMCNSGRHEGVHIIGPSQYPAQVDKAFLSNATLIHCGFLGEEPHRKAVASRMDIPQEMLRDLPDLHYLEWDRSTRAISKGTIAISGRYTQALLERPTTTGESATLSRPKRAKKPT